MTLPRYSTAMNTSEEAWMALPGHDGYEVSNMGRVRSWRRKGSGDELAIEPHVLTGQYWKGEQRYTIAGERFSIDSLMLMTMGVEDGEWESEDFELDAGTRDLSQYEINEIRMSEGYKEAWQVAEEFRINAERVRSVWDGEE